VIPAGEIRELGDHFDIDDIRVARAHPNPLTVTRMCEQRDAGFFFNSRRLGNPHLEQFCDVRTKLHEARSVITACQCYLTDEPVDASTPGNPHGRIARYTWRNHYRDLKHRLQKLADMLKEKYHAHSLVFSNGPVAEKPVAAQSGIGHYGKHSIIIHPRYGSWIVLGEIVTDIEIETDPALGNDCQECRKCIDACPTSAIVKPYVIDRRRCIQALTNWHGVVDDDIAAVWENRLYGCMSCQEVCPLNERVKPLPARTDIGYVGPSIPLLDILTMDETQYRRQYKDNQMTAHWINFSAIQRNALLCLGHLQDNSMRSLLHTFLRSDDPVLAQTAGWALSRTVHG
jgi:epoxyqueuosine reductase